RVVTVSGQPIKLTQIEYRIVETLARQPGRVLTYSYLLEHIWGPYAASDSNRILRVNMSNIRKKIEKDKLSPQYILTEIGVGYRMAD
ncbi:MAG: response regulator transcription factor, partial [Clostridia bacterium]|nr:response regulator transcription factor [Clostridia bacterium]